MMHTQPNIDRGRPPTPGPIGDASRRELGEVFTDLSGLFETLSEDEKSAFGTLLFGADLPPLTALARAPAELILKSTERIALEVLEATETPATPAQAATMVLVMKGTRLCNLRCTYCNAWREGPGNVMPFSILAKAIRDALLAPRIRHVEFVWHGGEITLLGTAFLRKALWLQRRYLKPGVSVSNAVQSNAVDISDEMMMFLRDHHIAVGVSIDGPPAINDRRRVDTHGEGTSARIRATLERFRQFGVGYGLLAVIDAEIAALPPRELLDYFVSTGATKMDVLNVLPENETDSCTATDAYIPWPRYVAFMADLFDVWWTDYRHRLDIRSLSALADKMVQRPNNLCVFAGNCQGKYLTIEANGGVSACDKYVGLKAYEYGSLKNDHLNDILKTSPRLDAAQTELNGYKSASEPCQWFSICNGGCPHDRKLSRELLGDDQGCCGLKSLLDRIAGTVSAAPAVAE